MAKNLSEAAAKTTTNVAGKAGGKGCLPKAIGGAVALVIVLLFLGYVFNFADTDANRIGLHYGGGIIEDKNSESR